MLALFSAINVFLFESFYIFLRFDLFCILLFKIYAYA